MSAGKLGIAIVGAGKAARLHAQAVRAGGAAEVLYICGRREQSSRETARLFDVPKWTIDYQEVLRDGQVGAVVVASPDQFHCEQTVAAAKAGKHVLCEKPMCRSVEEADRMIEAAQNNGVILMVGFTERYNHPCAEAKRRIDAGEIGAPKMILARRCHSRSVVRGRTWLNDAQTGGVLHYAGVHNIDLVCWFMGGPPQRVYAEMGQLLLEGQRFTDCAVMTYRFPSGAIAVQYETFAYPAVFPSGLDRSIEILGETGLIRLDFMSQPLSVVSAQGLSVEDSVTWPIVDERLSGALAAEMEHFLRCVRENRRPLTTGEDGRQAIRIADAALQAAAAGRAVTI